MGYGPEAVYHLKVRVLTYLPSEGTVWEGPNLIRSIFWLRRAPGARMSGHGPLPDLLLIPRGSSPRSSWSLAVLVASGWPSRGSWWPAECRGGLPHQSHLDSPPVVAILEDRVSGSGDDNRVNRPVGGHRDHPEDVAAGYLKPVRVATGLYHIGRSLSVQEVVLGRYRPDRAGDVRPIYGCAVYRDIPAAQVLIKKRCHQRTYWT